LSLVPTSAYIESAKAAPWGIDFTPGPAYLAHSIFLSFFLCLSFIALTWKVFHYKGADKARIKYVLLGVFITAAVGITVNYVLPLLGVTQFNKLGPMATTFLVCFTSYAIVKHQLMDISVIISRTFAELLTVAALGSVYLGLIWSYVTYVSTSINVFFIGGSILYGILVGQIYQKTRLFFQTTADKVFLRGKYDYYKELAEASRKVGEKLSLSAILGILYKTFSDVLEAANPKIFLPENFNQLDAAPKKYVVYDKSSFLPLSGGEAIQIESPLVQKLISSREPMLNPQDHNKELLIPCLLEDRLIAIFVLDSKLSEDPYTDEDIKLLEVLASQAAVALDHTRSYEKITMDLETAEKQLARSERLSALGTLTAGVTHEIRNPLGVIRMGLNKLPFEPRGVEYLKEFRDKYVKHVDRITGIVKRMLGLAKQKERKRVDMDLNEIIESVLELFPLGKASLKKELQPLPSMQGDPDEFHEVFINLFQNAVEAMPGGGQLTVKSYAEKGRTFVQVSDTGKGIPDTIREKIFDAFFSTRHEGAGLGLAITYRIVREHGGDIEVKSQEGQVTTFTLSF
ncbi:MAG: hypothetical protein KJ811_03150, partial [Candidatus Margulisbacteria bacterium]|nr:hypothetical protein [Candidatus Margulisiibacteriota bacterium]